MPDIRYVDEIGTDNWLDVRLSSGERISLPYGVKVDVQGRAAGRDTFAILEGVNKGKLASVAAKGPNASYLTPSLKHLGPGSISFDSKSQTLRYGGMGPFNAFSGGGVGGFTPVPPGTYKLAIPAFPSKQTRVAYARWTQFHKTWFRIGTNVSGSRFLHPGEISDGCVTVRQFVYDGKPGSPPPPDGFPDLQNGAISPSHGLLGLPLPPGPAPVVSYDNIYRYLILRRADDQSVGTLTVTDDGRR